MENNRFKAEPILGILGKFSPENEKAVEDICGILNGKTLDEVETILNQIRLLYSRAIFFNKDSLQHSLEAILKEMENQPPRVIHYDE